VPRPPHFRLDEKGSVPETLRYEGRLDMRSLGELTDLTLPAADEDSAAAGPRSSKDPDWPSGGINLVTDW
jgi:hypothetical protein